YLIKLFIYLGITLIGSESRNYYHSQWKYCSFIITDISGYVLYLMWIIITVLSLLATIRYIRKFFSEVNEKRKNNAPLLSLSVIKQGIYIANKELIMQQILQRIKLNIILIVLFILFWLPLFIVTIIDTKFRLSERLLRILLIIAWSNSSISPLCYLLLLPKFSDLCFFCLKSDKKNNKYDTLTSYYNRVGDRFHDLAQQHQQQSEQQQTDDSNSEIRDLTLQSNKLFVKEQKSNRHSYAPREYLKETKIVSSSSDSSSPTVIVQQPSTTTNSSTSSSSLTIITSQHRHHHHQPRCVRFEQKYNEDDSEVSDALIITSSK
ncbi:unnamed protein product, partial [Didymodactylos carnosus]